MAEDRKPKIPFYKDIEGQRLPGFFSEETYHSALAYKPQDDDLFIVTHPKCGTTWVGSIVACIYRQGRPMASGMEFLTQTPFLEMTGAEGALTMKRPGAFKMHTVFHKTPWSPKAKYIFVARNPKDCCVSFYHHTVNLPGYKFKDGEFDDFFELFIEGKTDFGDYFDTLMSWYEHRNDPNVFFITYEQIKKDNKKYVLKIAEFMGPQYKEALEGDEKLLSDVIHHSSFGYMKEAMKKHFEDFATVPKEFILNHPDIPKSIKELLGAESNPFSEGDVQFVRKGIVGDWKNHFSAEQNERLEEKFRERTKGTELADLWKDEMKL